MQPDGTNAKQLIVDKIRQSTNILVAVNSSPSVDALSAALALTMILNKLDKHATAVFSGTLPPAIEFLEPGKTFESTVDSLRDFIISLDKEKADRLRYKVEDDVVKIFITPYRSTITQEDLIFSQGDFNVELIIALGVEKRDELDKAITAHGRILHDATIVTINANNQRSALGAIDLHDPNASSLSEMLVSLIEALQQPGLLDGQTSTALLTGIVAATERFSNAHTTPKVMTMSAQLMAAGANQQLIANNLRKAHEIPDIGEPLSVQQAAPTEDVPPTTKSNGELDITHDKKKAAAKSDKAEKKETASVKVEKASAQAPTSEQKAENALSAALPTAAATTAAFDELKQAIEEETPISPKVEAPTLKPLGEEPKKEEPKLPATPPPAPGSQDVNAATDSKDEGYIVGANATPSRPSWQGKRIEPPQEPTLGGSLSATSEQALNDARKAQEEDRNKVLLTHPGDTPTQTPPTPVLESPVDLSKSPPESVAPPLPPAEPLAPPPSLQDLQQAATSAATEASATMPPTAPLGEPTSQTAELPPAEVPAVDATGSLDAARQAVSDALASQPFNPANQPLESVGAQPMQNIDPTPPAEQGSLNIPVSPAPLPPADLPPLPPLPPMPPLPTHNDPAMPIDPQAPLSPPAQGQLPPAGQNDPGQFRIPGQ